MGDFVYSKFSEFIAFAHGQAEILGCQTRHNQRGVFFSFIIALIQHWSNCRWIFLAFNYILVDQIINLKLMPQPASSFRYRGLSYHLLPV